MIDAKLPLRKAYMAKLAGITYNSVAVPVYYQYIPDLDPMPANYIIFGNITDNDQSTINSQDSLITMQVKIHTWSVKDNDGDAADLIASEVLARIYPINGPNIDLRAEGLDLHSTKKVNDFTEDWTVDNQKVYIDRTLQFSHNIFYL